MDNNSLSNSPTIQTLPQVTLPTQSQAFIPTQPSTPSNLPRNLVFATLGIVILSGTAFAGFQLGKNQKEEQLPITKQPATAPTQIVTTPIVIPTQIVISPSVTLSPTATNPSSNTIPGWKIIAITPDPDFGLSDYQISIPNTWKQTTHSSNFQNTETFQDSNTNTTYNLVITQEKNINAQTGNPFTKLRELTGLSYDVDTVKVAGLTAAKVLPRAGSESDFMVLFFSPDNKQIVNIKLSTPSDGSKIKEGQELFDQILSTFKYTSN